MSADWPLKRISEVAQFLNNKRVPLKSLDREKRQGQYPYYGASGIVDHIDDFIFDGTYLLISEDGENLRTRNTPIAFKAHGKFWVNNHAHILGEKEEGILDYLEYYFSQLDLTPYITGAVQPKLNKANLDRIEIPVPPHHERLEINRVLNDLTDKIQLNHQINQTLEQMAQAIFKSWFVDFEPVKAKIAVLEAGGSAADAELAAMQAISGKDADLLAQMAAEKPEQYAELQATAALFPTAMHNSELGEIPEGWSVSALGDIAKIVKGKSYKSAELSNSATALVTLKSFNRGGGYRLDGLKEYTGKYKPEQEVSAGDLIISYTDVTQAADVIGKPAMVIGDARYEHLVISLDVAVVRPQDDSLKPYLYGLAKTDDFQFHTKSFTTGTTVLHLAKNAVPDYQFPLPTKNLTDAYASQVKPLFSLIDNQIQEGRSLEELRDALLPKLLSGELTLPEAENQLQDVANV
ncbi:restriction endonuclease subunit S [Motiliproteus sediminis]|uniref:restriction endonuclease subunit S n=1 Tax=Motiliproteus sediminis TaxID=1468178 RepID=UPI001AEFFA02|nr:restriction endonuclease subunit S [Motiliproteus sediminis]